MNLIAKRIVEARKTRGLSQEELAEKANLNLRTVQRIENSENEPRGKTLNLICDVLEINSTELVEGKTAWSAKRIANIIVTGLFLIALNMILMGIIGYLTLDSNANLNSRVGGVLVSILLPFSIVVFTRKMSSIERVLYFGSGYVVYFLMTVIKLGFPRGFVVGLIPCLLISVTVLYFGNAVFKKK